MRIRDLSEKFIDQTPEVDGNRATSRSFPNRIYRRLNTEEIIDLQKNLIDYMGEQGWDYIGKGHFSMVFESPKSPGMVLKLMPERDSGYMRFYSHAKRSDNPHFPVVSRMGVMNIPDPMYAVLIEKLQSYSYVYVARLVDPIMDFMIDDQEYDLPSWIDEKYPQLRSALLEVKAMTGTKARYISDLHNANILWRGDFPVIADPLASQVEIR